MSELPTDEPVSMSYDSESKTHLAEFDSDAIAPSMAVVEAMASVHDTAPTALEPLVETIDPAAIDRLVKGNDGSDDRVLEFHYLESVVTVHGRGVVEIRPADGDGDG